ncbi:MULTISPECIES: thiopeptide-type bacteriocin biosynthesis protein [unclassified Streptomyces]|uniref:thiopeptide-type bacteriocin biosynthesis protein n=1 Tax=unclassified Streptomyces TaxID=2593676 RepID=UPI001BEA8AFF|nr:MULTISPECIES: thiopeptide-type bacteriocin biosynthesis protein [unclassified Streptomyces]MBT2406298.1 thiopeptide-type bacteriocin biosynthesis protein [Streptomyces sp. ISL-21]MBT2607385.1 thiopeptide-type bacteriocin biosynthesis protein [Streptomyces sp. ISL-87]
MITAPHRTDRADPGTEMDWWYVRAYPGHPDAMDEATRVLIPWLAARASEEAASAWFFTRYWDMSGHHLRLRLRCSADGIDRIYDRLPELVGLLHTLDRPTSSDRLVPGSVPQGLPMVKQARCCIYAPELAKYGGARGVARAEELFTASCRWYADQQIGALAPLFDRAALAVSYMSTLVREALPDPQARTAFWTAHRRQWGRQLRMAAPGQAELRGLLTRAAQGTGEAAARLDAPLRESAERQAGTVVRTLDAAAADENPVAREGLLLHYLHMDLNRWGFVPAEESLLGVLASAN